MTYRGFDKKGVVIANKTVVNGSDDHEQRLYNFYKGCLERFITLEAGQRVGINEVEVQALKCRHSDPNAIGFKFFTPKFTLAYTGDTSYSPELLEQYQGANILILNVTAPKKADSPDHLTCEGAIKVIKAVKPRLAIITHFGIKMIEEDPMYLIREIQKETGVQTIAAKDGMIINPLSYAIDKGQRTLVSYPKKKGVEVSEIKKEDAEQNQEDKPEQITIEPEPQKEEAKELEPKPEPPKEKPKEAPSSDKSLKDIFLQEASETEDVSDKSKEETD
jgi:hypothetical protein